MSHRNLLLFAVVLAVLSGCGPGSGLTANPPNDGKASEAPAGKTDGKAAPPSLSDVPEPLRHDGYAYNGFGRTEQLTYLFARMKGEKPSEGTQVAELKSLAADKATFTVRRGGALSALGEDEVEVRSDGVYLVSSSLGTPKEPVRVMPAQLVPGTVWTYAFDSASGTGGKTSFKSKAKVLKTETVSVAGQTFETILVTETADMTQGSDKGTVASKTWYAKDVGVVKMRMEVKQSNGNVVTSTIDLAPTKPEANPEASK